MLGGNSVTPGKGLFLMGMGGAILLLMPLVLHPYPLLILGYALVFSIACLGLNLLFGNTGLVSFGHAAFFGVGAYAGGFIYAFSPVNSLFIKLARPTGSRETAPDPSECP